ncbi:MAG: peptide ABC transporter substrate-binding protein [Caldilineaceae bacterium]|nr:peptide ABC transporter substrate-binding protein [Caldilineaceae bacterium]
MKQKPSRGSSIRIYALWLSLVVLLVLLAGCVAPAGSTTAPEAAATAVPAEEAAAEEVPAETVFSEDAFTTPHPILSDVRVRQAIAHCTDRDALIASVYPYVDDETRPTLRMDSFLPKTHWAYSGPYQDYPYDPAAGAALLDEAGWTLPDGGAVRQNANGDPLALSLTTTDAQFRQTWAAVAEQNLEGCGFDITRNHTPASWWFGDTTGLARREFELGAFAWVGEANPKGQTLYACNQIPTPRNNWEGQNSMGWCNQAASDAVVLANNTLDEATRIDAYNIVQEEFAKDMVSLPLFQRAEAEAWSTNLEGIRVSPTEYATASAADWRLADGGDTIVVGFSQEPASMFTLVESAAVQRQISQMAVGLLNSQFDYDFQPVMQDGFSTIEDGLATNELVTVGAGDTIYNADGEPEELAAGTRFILDGQVTEYDGTSELQLPQLVVTYKLKPYTWSDGTPGSIDDVRLAYTLNCDPESGAVDFITCRSIENIEYAEDGALEWTVTYLPNVQDPYYYMMPFWQGTGLYPAHQVVSDGRRLADVPAAEWTTLPEIAEMPLSYGPFVITEWIKGQSITMERNPHYAGEVGVERIVVVFITDTNQAVAQLLSGDVDYLEKATLGGGAEVQTLIDAAESGGEVHIDIIPSPTWEHIDMNMYIP